MKTKPLRLLLHVLAPLAVGTAAYFIPVSSFIHDHLADGLWAYSLTASLLIIWDGRVKVIWLMIIFIVFIMFEVFQSFGIIPGTGDLIDIGFYFIFSFLALATNKLFYKTA